MKHELIDEICKRMEQHLSRDQKKLLEHTLNTVLNKVNLPENGSVDNKQIAREENEHLIRIFIASKKIEGCSENTLKYYSNTLLRMIGTLNKNIYDIDTNDLRMYLSNYQAENNISKVTLDNIRRIMSSFFSWLEDEDHIRKSPVRRIRKVKTTQVVKETLSDEHLEQLRDECRHSRDLAIIDLLVSTGIRVGELVTLNISDINFTDRECVVLGKGDKERKVYFDAKTKIHLKQYLSSRTDDNPALFVSKQAPYNRLSIAGVERFLAKLGDSAAVTHVHPHKFRRTMATMAIDKGMPIEQVQKLLGHSQIETTLHYAIVNQTNVKNSHRRFVC